MNMSLIIGLAFIAGALVTALLLRWWSGIERRLSALEQAQKPKRHTHKTIAGIEDAMAVAIDLALQAEADERRTRQLLEILQILRQGPYHYEPNRPAGKR